MLQSDTALPSFLCFSWPVNSSGLSRRGQKSRQLELSSANDFSQRGVMARQMRHFDGAASIPAQCGLEANVFSNSSVLPADLNTLIIVFERKVPLCFFKERHSSKRCQEALFFFFSSPLLQGVM